MKDCPRIRFRAAAFLSGLVGLGLMGFVSVSSGQSPDSGESGPEDDGQAYFDNLPSDLIELNAAPRNGTADKFARIFSAELRDIEERQSEIILKLEILPRLARGMIQSKELGYHDGESRRRKWVQVDLGEQVEPDAIALFPVTEQIDDQTVPGYGFPRLFQVDISDDRNFASNVQTMIDSRVRSRFSPKEAPFYREVSDFSGRYLRVWVLNRWRPPGEEGLGKEAFALSELMVLKGERNIAQGRPTTFADSAPPSDRWSSRYLTDGKTALGLPHESTASPTLGFRAELEKGTELSVQIDLEEAMTIEEIRVIPANPPDVVTDPSIRFPNLFRVEISDAPDMKEADMVTRVSAGQGTGLDENPVIIPVKEGYGRYVRITAERRAAGPIAFALSEVQVFSENRNVALNKTVRAPESVEGEGWSQKYLVDGYSSRYRLTSYSVWLDALRTRGQLIEEFRDLEVSRNALVEQTLERSVKWGAGGGGGVLLLVVFGLARSRVRRRKDLEGLRQQIASDLHDDIGSNLSSIALLAELGHSEADEVELVREELSEIKKTADRTVESMRDIVWLIRPGEETWKQLVARFRETAAKMLKAHIYQFENKGSMHDERLPLDFKRDIFLIYKEVLNNIVRHAEAHRVHIDLETRRGRLLLKVADDGRGFDNLDQNFREGNGLKNLRRRAQSLGASLKVRSAANEGTTVQLSMPIP